MSDEIRQSDPQSEKKPQKSNGSGSAVTYLVILFAVAFLLLLLAYFMQLRTSEETIGNLKESITSFESLDALVRENQELREENESLREQTKALEDQLLLLEDEYHSLSEKYSRKTEQGDLLNLFCSVLLQIREGDYEGARASLNEWEPGRLAEAIAAYDAEMSHRNGEQTLASVYESCRQLLEEKLGSGD